MLVLLPVISHGQENLVPNGDFEIHWDFPPSGPYLLPLAHPWTTTGAICSPDYFNADCPPIVFTPDTLLSCGVPANSRGYQLARSGNGYAGFFAYSRFQTDGREFIQIELVEPIVESIRYRVTFYVSLADEYQYAVRTLGAFFSDSVVSRESYQIMGLNIEPHIVNSSPFPLSNKYEWIELTDTFSSRVGGERYLVIGNFMLDNESDTLFVGTGERAHAYYYIDDVSVVAIDSIPNSVTEEEAHKTFKVHPNPNNGMMTLEYQLGEGEKGILEVFSLMGQRVYAQGLRAESSHTTVELSDVTSGIYMIRIVVDGNLRLSEKMTILKE